ncbi:MAG TPA: glycogen synthase GlgA [Acidobacteriota bacterium]|nr:glycogen synthase GlgA [Acidobacteriota bacterium]
MMLAAEAAPYAKVGGLADVVGSLPKVLEPFGVDVTVIIPAYKSVNSKLPASQFIPVADFDIPMASFIERAEVGKTRLNGTSVDVYLIGSRRYFDREGIYDDPATGEGYPDNMERFIFFMKAALELLLRQEIPVDILHCHDSHAGLIPALIRGEYGGNPRFSEARTLLTIHNLAHQGIYPRKALEHAGIAAEHFFPMSPFEYWGQVNFMKAGIELADKVNTVSRTYAREIQQSAELGFGLEEVLRKRKDDLSGIVNGIDYDEWNPEKDPYLPARYSIKNLSGKEVCKKHLQQYFRLEQSEKRVPLIGMISRLTDQKGFDLVAEAVEDLAGLDMQMVFLGSGQIKYQELLTRIAARYPEKFAVRLGFDDELAHRIEAGCDLFLMPSKFEPCGLNQLYSLRYGTIPVVRKTGGLSDTVIDYERGKGTGFTFSEYSSRAMVACIGKALKAYSDVYSWKVLMIRAMSQDWSWTASARKYVRLYETILSGKSARNAGRH